MNGHIICSHCDLPITGKASATRKDLHPFCYELWHGEALEAITEALEASDDYVEVSPGMWQAKSAIGKEGA